MEITRRTSGDIMDVELAGRLDGYWSDHLKTALGDVVSGGTHHIRLDCSRVTFLSSAGIGVLMKFHKELGRINGSFRVINPSSPVATVLRVTRLDAFLVPVSGPAAPQPARERPARRITGETVAFDVFDIDAAARLTCRAIGTPALTNGGVVAADRG